MKLNPLVSALIIGGALLAPHALVQAQAKPIELRYSSGAPPKGNPWVMQIERFAKEVDEESKGEIKIQPFLASQLGSEQDTVQQVARGRIDMGGYSGGSAALVLPEVALLLMPFYFRNAAEVDCVLDNHMTKIVTDGFAKKGVHFLGWTSVGSIDMFGKKPFMAPPDLKGAKAAIYANKTQALFFSSMGASVNPLGLPEWIPAFQTGMADVVLTTITYGLPSGTDQGGAGGVARQRLRLAGPDADEQGRVGQAVQAAPGSDHARQRTQSLGQVPRGDPRLRRHAVRHAQARRRPGGRRHAGTARRLAQGDGAGVPADRQGNRR